MGNNPSVSIQTTVASITEAVPYLNRALITFVPEDSTFASNFAASTQPWMYQSPATLQGLVAELSPQNWEQRLKSLGATDSEPVWTAVEAHFTQLAVADPNGVREQVSRPDLVFIGRRTSAVVSENTFTFGTNTAGRVRIRVNQARYLYSGSTPAGSLADVTIVADGVKTVAQLATEAAAALTAVADFAAHFTATDDGVDTVTVTGLVAGYPLVLSITVSTPGPTITQAVTTANVALAYDGDLDEMQEAAEFGSQLDFPSRKWYWITDLQGDDVVNAEGMAWVEDQEDDNTPPRDYQFVAWSTSGARRITIGGNFVGNFDPTSTDSAAQTSHEANGGTGWTRASVHDHDRYEFLVPALLGRTIGYLPGQISFTSKVLFGDTDASKMSPRDFGDNETLTNGDDRSFNWYSAEGPAEQGSAKWGYLADGSFMDRKWLEDYVNWRVRVDLLAWMQLKNIVTYTDVDLRAGAGIIELAMAKIPAIIPETIGVVSIGRDAVNPANIVARVYYGYSGDGTSGGIVNKIGTPDQPVPIIIADG